MDENSTFPYKKEINPFSDIEKSPIEGQPVSTEADGASLGVGQAVPAPVAQAPASEDHREDTDLFLQSILKDSASHDTATSETEKPSPEEPGAPVQKQENVSQAGEYENLIDLGRDEEPEHDTATNRTTMQDIIPSDKVTSLGSANRSKPLSGQKMLIIAGVIAVVIVAIYLISSGGKSNNASTTVAQTPIAQQFATDVMRKSDLAKVKDALLKYNQAKGSFPKADKTVFLSVPENIISKALVPAYLDLLPSDPDPTRKYGYKSDGKDFNLSAVLDNSNDPSIVVENSLSLYKVTSQSVESYDNNITDTSQSALMENQAGDYVFEP